MATHQFGDSKEYQAEFQELVKAHLDAAKWCAFWPMIGPKYTSAKPKLLVCGRALNGWDETTFSFMGDTEALVDRCIGAFGSDSGKKNPLGWVEDRWQKGDNYRTSRSAFWRVVRSIAARLGYKDDGWTEYIAWTNLMRVSPATGGNPEEWSWNAQLPHASRMLLKEIRELTPDVTVVLAGSSWFDPFRNHDGFRENFTTIADPPSGSKYVKLVGSMGDMRVVVGPYPQGKNEKEILDEIGPWLPPC